MTETEISSEATRRTAPPPRPFPVVTVCLVCANVLCFFLPALLGWTRQLTVQDLWLLHRLGALHDGMGTGDAWRYLAMAALHSDIFHIVMNSLALFSIGPHLERVVAPARFATMYFVAVLVSSVW